MSRFSLARGKKIRGTSRPAAITETLEPRRLLSATAAAPISSTFSAPGGSATTVSLANAFTDATTTVVELTTNVGPIDIALSDKATPKSVKNFLNYVKKGLYNNTIFHRSVPGFIVQAGGYTPAGVHIKQFKPVVNEFDPSRSNVRGTIAFAKLGGNPNSATSEFFFNLADNGSNLDNQNGGFTTFGTVVNNTLGTVDNIAALPIVDGSSINAKNGSALSTLPVLQNVPPATLAPSNLVTIETAKVVSDAPEFTYTATSDNPALVTPTVTGDSLSLAYPGGATAGTARITVTATDPNGISASQTFLAGVGQLPVTVGTGGAKSVAFTDAAGHRGVVTLAGPGAASVVFTGTGLTQGGNAKSVVIGGAAAAAQIVTTATTSKSALRIKTSGGTIDVGRVSTDAPLGSISAPGVNLTGALTAAGPVAKLALGSATGATISLDDVAAGRGAASLSFGSLTNTTITDTGAVKSIAVKGNVTGSTITLSGTPTAGPEVAKFSVGGAFASSKLVSVGNVGSVSAGSSTGSAFYAGLALAGGATLPSTAGEFASQSSIASVKIKSDTGTDLAAFSLGKISLGLVHVANGGTPFGVAAHAIAALSGKTDQPATFKLRNLASQADVTAQLTRQHVTLTGTDLVVNIV